MEISCSNARNFNVSPLAVNVPAFGSADICVEYIPSSIGEVRRRDCTVTVLRPLALLWWALRLAS
eukprot:6209834-Pyramimonas_sp.AAC.1